MAGNKTTVTHPDGTVSKRTSKTRSYTHAVVLEQTRDYLVDQALTTAAVHDRAAEAFVKAAASGDITEERRDWTGGRTYISLYLGGKFADSYVDDRPRPSDDELRAKHLKRAAEQRAGAEKYRKLAATHAAGPEAVYGVLRWSSRADLAHKAVTGEFSQLVCEGVKVYAVAVDQP